MIGSQQKAVDFYFPMHRSIIRLSLVYVALLVCCIAGNGQQVRLRSQLTPQCTPIVANSTWKFADIYADGNIAVQGSYLCRGAFIYDISNPDAPVLKSWYNPGNDKQFLEAIVIGNRGYFGSGNQDGVHIVDLSDPANPVLLGVVNHIQSGHWTIHEMMVFDQAGKRYLVENYNASSIKPIKILDITDPTAAVLKWEFSPPDSAWVHAMHIRGNRMFMSEYSGAKVDIYDISNIANQAPTLTGAVTANTTNHSSWTSEDGNYLYSARETFDGDLRVYDITDPQVPLLRKTIKAADLNINAVTPHNPVVKGNRLYVSWYQAGVQIFDISDPANPVRIGQYDTVPAAFDSEKAAAEFALREEPWDMVCGAENLQNSLPNSYDGNWTVFPFLGDDKLIAGDMASGLMILDATGLNSPPRNPIADFDGDRKTDISVFDPNNGRWTIEASSSGSQYPVFWGLQNDVPVPADYDGDGKTDAAVWRPSDGRWYILYATGAINVFEWGLTGDLPVPGDYDADGRADFAVWRPSNGTWYIVQSTLGVRIQEWGLNGDKPVVGDYEGDGKTDLAVWRPSNGTWYMIFSSSNQLTAQPWGFNGDQPLVTDFDGNMRDEMTVFRPSENNWYSLDQTTGAISVQSFGLAGDLPIPADYDGDTKTDIAVHRPSNNTWYFVYTTDYAYHLRSFGQSGEMPAPGAVQPR
jgi:hypothetical protein